MYFIFARDLPPMGLTFMVCDVKEPIISFSLMLKMGHKAHLQPGDMHLNVHGYRLPLVHEESHFWVDADSFVEPPEDLK